MMKQLFYLMLCVALLAGCSSDSGSDGDEPEKPENPKNVTLELSRNELVFEAAGGEKTFTVSSNGNWTIENGSGWCKTDFNNGTGNLTITVTVDEYSGLEDRNTNLTVKAGDKTQVLGVTQKGEDAIIVSKDKFEVPQEGETISVEVKSNIAYEVKIPEEFQSWIAQAPDTRSVTTKSYDFSISENGKKQTRSGYIVFSGNSLYDTVWVYQSQFVEQLILTEDSYELPAEGGEIVVELKTNVNYDIQIPTSAESWITRVYTRSMRTDKLYFSVSENKKRDDRSASITIKDRDGNLSDVLYIRQSGCGFILSERELVASVCGDTLSVKLRSGIEYTVTIPSAFQSWIIPLGEASSRICKFAVSANEDTEVREGYIVFSGNSLTDTVYVTQYYLDENWLEMIYVQGGTFMMGATAEQGDDAYSNEEPAHEVTLSDYYIGKFEVTQGLWEAVMGKNPSYFSYGDDYPVENVSWYEIQDFLRGLNRLTGRRYVLPTEAQWEYAARGGNKSKGYKYSGSNDIDEVSWYSGNSGNKPHPVGKKSPNELGIYDMSGNVWEWCSDRYGSYSSKAQIDPTGFSTGSSRVVRGGSWGDNAMFCRVSLRYSSSPDGRYGDCGFRVVCLP